MSRVVLLTLLWLAVSLGAAPSSTSSSSTSSSTSSTGGRETAPTLATAPPGELQLLLVVSVFRAGARSPFYPLPGTLGAWSPVPGIGRLTDAGVTAMLQLGKSLGDVYNDFLPGNGLFSPTVARARASDHEWTLLAAQAVLRGMFPESWVVRDEVPQVFPVHVNQDKDDLLLLAPRNCPVYRFAMMGEIHQANNPVWVNLLNETADLVAQLRELVAGTTLDPAMVALETWDVVFDPVECSMANGGVGLPRGLSPALARRVLDVGDELERLHFPSNLGGLLGGNMMDHFLELMQGAVHANASRTWETPPRMHLFAGHRETLSALLSVLGQELAHAPRFGDHVELELLRQTATGRVLVRARHNSRPRALRVCRNASASDGDACELSVFVAEMRAKMALDWGLSCRREDAVDKCAAKLASTSYGLDAGTITIWSPVNGLWYVVSATAGLLVVAVAILVFWKWKHHARVDDVPEEVPMQPMRKPRGPKKFTLE